MKLGYGCITLSYNMGSYIDNDFIYDAQIQENGSVRIKYQCGRTDNKYSALLVWNKAESRGRSLRLGVLRAAATTAT